MKIVIYKNEIDESAWVLYCDILSLDKDKTEWIEISNIQDFQIDFC